ncbi:Trimethyllysine dioxygenase [Coprinellus micaceus]|uniref:trimethyllysine dioxygenase n=1 Tax=Coprinellus micaceus TaxID=71717 RepID=A0A4Y7TMH7_COPMI|nr:Trimethyllysine dioxygenase [Coprinellus micaceus]
MLRGARTLSTACSVARRASLARNLRKFPLQAKPHIPSTRSLASAAQAQAPTHTPTPESSQSPVRTQDLPIVSNDAKQVAVGWDTRTWSKFHNIWLRDHCRCPKCFHAITKQRLLNTFEIPRDIAPLTVAAKPDGLEVTWNTSDAHISLYPWSWLRFNSYDPPSSSFAPSPSITDDGKPEKVLWGAKIQQSPPTVTYEQVMEEGDAGLYKWLENVDKFGFSFVTGVPPTPEATEELSERIGFIRETQYGKFWDFTSDLAKGDTAYTTLALGAHTDNTYFTDPCGLQLFHLLSHTGGTGGSTLLVDGFYVASLLKSLHPEAYHLLSTVPVPAHAAGEPSALYQPSPVRGYPVLGHVGGSSFSSGTGGSSTFGGESGKEGEGELVQVRWNNDDRSVMSHLEPAVVEKWYDAIRLWNKALTSPDSQYWVQLTPGTAVVVDNHRVLHGRSAFTGKRRMCGAYIGVDEYRSKLAVLRERFASDPVLEATKDIPESVVAGRSVWHTAL